MIRSLIDFFRMFLNNLVGELLCVVFAVGLPFGLLILGEAVDKYRFPHGNSPFSGVGVVGFIATFALWCAWQQCSTRVHILVAFFRVLLCYALAFIPTFWLIPGNSELYSGICAALAYFIVGLAALNVWKPLNVQRSVELERGAGKTRTHSTNAGWITQWFSKSKRPSTTPQARTPGSKVNVKPQAFPKSKQPTNAVPGETSYQEMLRKSESRRSR